MAENTDKPVPTETKRDPKVLSPEATNMIKDQAKEIGQNGFMICPRDNLD